MNEKDLNMHFLDYSKLKFSVKKVLQMEGTYNNLNDPFLPRTLFEIGLTEKVCNRIYNRLMIYNGNILWEVKEKWETVLNEDIRYKTVEKAFIDLSKCKGSAYQKYFRFKLLH